MPMLASSSPSFNSRTPGGVRLQLDTLSDDEFTFQFTHPGRGATNTYSLEFDQFVKFQFTHPGRGATALHAQRADGVAVSIHAPREGCDSSTRSGACVSTSFQFTHPGRGATRLPQRLPTHGNVSIHAPREGCDWNRQNAYNTPYVSIHAPREGCDPCNIQVRLKVGCFNSRTPGGVRRRTIICAPSTSVVSIHAPREGCDLHLARVRKISSSFNSRTPGGVRHDHHYHSCAFFVSFNSRTPGGVRREWLYS